MPKKPSLLGTLLEVVSQRTEVISAIDSFMAKRESSKPPYIPKGFHPSSLNLETCARALVYEHLGVAPESFIGPSLMRIFENGTYSGMRIQQNMVDAGILRVDQTEVPVHGCTDPEKRKRYKPDMLKVIDAAAKRASQYEIRGHADGFNPFHKSGSTIYEIKTMNTMQWNQLRAPVPKHVVQASLYADCFAAKRVIYIYEDKNTNTPKEFVTTPDATAVADVKKIVAYARDGLKERMLPGRHDDCPSKSSAKAGKCPFSRVCFSEKSFAEVDARAGKEPRDYR